MGFKMNMMLCVAILTSAQHGCAVYNFDWVNGKPVRRDRRDVRTLLRGAEKLPVGHYGALMATLVNLPKEDTRDFLGNTSHRDFVSTARGHRSVPTNVTARPSVMPYGDLAVTLLGQSPVDSRDVSVEPSRPAVHAARKNGAIKRCSNPRPDCIIVNGMVCHRTDQIRKDWLVGAKKS